MWLYFIRNYSNVSLGCMISSFEMATLHLARLPLGIMTRTEGTTEFGEAIMHVKLGLLLLSVTMLTACSGHVVLTPLAPDKISEDYKAGANTDGIIVYRPQPFIEVDQLTQISAPAKGAGAPTLSDNCKRVAVRKFVSAADWEHPYRLHYEHGLLETYTFGATTTSDGILTVINAQSTPDQGKTFANLASAASSAAAAARAAPPPSWPDCKSTPVFVGYERPPTGNQIPDYGKTIVVP
jgi:hypothetical protein